MAIKVYPDRIEFGDYTLRSTDQGIEFDGEVEALDIVAGASYGYTSGGYFTPYTHPATIDKFLFASASNASDVGDLSQSREEAAGQSSTTYGYTSGGKNPPAYGLNTIDKFPFSADFETASDAGDLATARYGLSGQSSTTHGYNSGGGLSPVAEYQPNMTLTIDKFPFAADAGATTVGDLTQVGYGRRYSTGQSSSTHGYASGGRSPYPVNSGYLDVIEKFPFSADFTTATDVGNLTQGRDVAAGQSSFTHGYTSGGFTPDSTDTIDKFPFVADADATDVGNLTVAKVRVVGQSSGTHGYVSGGGAPLIISGIERFPFVTDGSATDVGNLIQARSRAAGQQGG